MDGGRRCPNGRMEYHDAGKRLRAGPILRAAYQAGSCHRRNPFHPSGKSTACSGPGP